MRNISITFRDGSYRPTASPILIQYFFDFLFLLFFFFFKFLFLFLFRILLQFIIKRQGTPEVNSTRPEFAKRTVSAMTVISRVFLFSKVSKFN